MKACRKQSYVIDGRAVRNAKPELQVPTRSQEMTFTLRCKLQAVTLFIYVSWVYFGLGKYKLEPCVFSYKNSLHKN